MTEAMDKATLLNKMQIEYAALERLINPLSAEQMTAPGVTGTWSIKDTLAHLAAWQQRLLDCLEAALRDEPPPWPPEDMDEEKIEAYNTRFYEENKSRPLDQVLDHFRSSYQRIVEATREFSEQDLVVPGRISWMKGEPLWPFIAGDTYEHHEEHARTIQEWLAIRSGD